MSVEGRGTLPVRPKGSPVATPWQWASLWRAPHRLAFFSGVLLLVASAAWWAVVQVDRASGVFGLSYAVSPTLTHAAVMTLGFMPLFFAAYYVARPSVRNAVLLLASLLFYYVGAGSFVLVLIGSVVLNDVCARLIARNVMPRALLTLGVIGNLVPLLYYKYWTFLLQSAGDLQTLFAMAPTATIAHIVLPAGISFFTFQGISYLVDVYRGDVQPA